MQRPNGAAAQRMTL